MAYYGEILFFVGAQAQELYARSNERKIRVVIALGASALVRERPRPPPPRRGRCHVNYASYAYSYYALVVFSAYYPEMRRKTCALSRAELCAARRRIRRALNKFMHPRGARARDIKV